MTLSSLNRRQLLLLGATSAAGTVMLSACGSGPGGGTGSESTSAGASGSGARVPTMPPTQAPARIPAQFSTPERTPMLTDQGRAVMTGNLTSHYLAGYLDGTLWYWDLAAPDSGFFYLTSTDGGATLSFVRASTMAEVPNQFDSGYATLPFQGIGRLIVADRDGTYGYMVTIAGPGTMDSVPSGTVMPEEPITILKVEMASGKVVAQATATRAATKYREAEFSLSADGSLFLAVGADTVLAWSTKDLSPHAPATAPDLGGLAVESTGDYVVVAALTERPDTPTTADLTVYGTRDWSKVATVRGTVTSVAASYFYAYDQEAAAWIVTDLGTGKAVDLKDPLPTGEHTQVYFSNGYVMVRSDSGFQVREPGSPTAVLSWMAADGATVPVTANVYGGYLYALNADEVEFQIYNLATGDLLMPAGGGLSYVSAATGPYAQYSLDAMREITEYGAVYSGGFYLALGWQDL